MSPWLEDTEDVISVYVPDEDGVYGREAIDIQPNPRLKTDVENARLSGSRILYGLAARR